MREIKEILKFLKIIDGHDMQLSLTSLAVWLVLGKILVSPIGFPSAVALFIALLSYQRKKVINNTSLTPEQIKDLSQASQKNQEQNQESVAEINKRLEDAEAKVSSVSMAQGF